MDSKQFSIWVLLSLMVKTDIVLSKGCTVTLSSVGDGFSHGYWAFPRARHCSGYRDDSRFLIPILKVLTIESVPIITLCTENRHKFLCVCSPHGLFCYVRPHLGGETYPKLLDRDVCLSQDSHSMGPHQVWQMMFSKMPITYLLSHLLLTLKGSIYVFLPLNFVTVSNDRGWRKWRIVTSESSF